jgi:hypothetical protein
MGLRTGLLVTRDTDPKGVNTAPAYADIGELTTGMCSLLRGLPSRR